MSTSRLSRVIAPAGVLLLTVACRANEDLTRALDAGAGRQITQAPKPVAHEWVDVVNAAPGNDSLRLYPRGVCIQDGRVVVADLRRNRLLVLRPDGRPLRSLGSFGAKPGQFLEIASVRCSGEDRTILATDAANQRLSIFDADRGFMRSLPAPVSPQVPVLGEYATGRGGKWYASWLGAAIPLGPYLSDAEWKSVPLAEIRSPDGKPSRPLGRPTAYQNTVARRVLNRTFLTSRRDTLWVLTEGDATLRGLTDDGSETSPIRLPVYFRGKEPSISVGEPFARSSFRSNRMKYHPNVRGLAVVGDTLFATIRYRNWGLTLIGRSTNRTIDQRAESAVEIFDRRGRVLRSLAVPGFATEVASDGRSQLAVVTQGRDGIYRVLLGHAGVR